MNKEEILNEFRGKFHFDIGFVTDKNNYKKVQDFWLSKLAQQKEEIIKIVDTSHYSFPVNATEEECKMIKKAINWKIDIILKEINKL